MKLEYKITKEKTYPGRLNHETIEWGEHSPMMISGSSCRTHDDQTDKKEHYGNIQRFCPPGKYNAFSCVTTYVVKPMIMNFY